MHPSVEQLLRVQAVDSEMKFMREAMRRRPEELAADRKKVEAARAAVEAVTDSLRELRIRCDKGELEIKNCDAEVEKLTVALNSASSNQEYSVLRDQIERQKETQGQFEEQVLDTLNDIDQLEEEKARRQRELEEQEKTFGRKEAELQALLAGMQAQVDELQAKRQKELEGVDPQHLQIYERVLQLRGDSAIAQVNSATCQGCFMTVTAQNINLLMIGQELVQCPHCSRLLYLE